MTNGPTQRESCPECGKEYEYEPNPAFKADLPMISEGLRDRLRWVIVSHPTCLAAREARTISENQRALDERRNALIEQRKQWRVRGVDEWYLRPSLPFDARSKTFANYTASADNSDAVAMVRAWSVADEFGLLIMGPAGTGKSHLAFAAISEIFSALLSEDLTGLSDDDLICIEERRFPAYVPVSSFLADLRAEGGKSDVRFIDAPLLFLDDLGAENMTDWSREIFFRIFDHRLNRRLPTIVTTNLGLNELKERLHERVVSRILASSVPVVLKGQDYRLNHMRNNARALADRTRVSA